MEHLDHEEISYCTVFDLRVSQDEIEVYESCMKYILKACSEEEIYNITGCTPEVLQSWQEELLQLLKQYVPLSNLPIKYQE